MKGKNKRKLAAAILMGVLTVSMGTSAKAAVGTVNGTWVPINAETGLMGYALADGSWLQDGFTADGYYVNKYGVWADKTRILSAWLPARNSWLSPKEVGDFEGFVPYMKSAQTKLSEDLHGHRVLSVYSNRITLSSIDTDNGSKKRTTRLAMYKNEDIDGYTLQVSTALAGDAKDMAAVAGGEWTSMSFYDYQILRLFTDSISRCGDNVAEAIYSSWEDDNSYKLRMNEWVQVGDTMICYVPDDGAGLYEIKAAF